MTEKFKSFLLNDHIFFGLLIIIVGVSSFGLGRASVTTKADFAVDFNTFKKVSMVEIVKSGQVVPAQEKVSTFSESLVASKSGAKYHLLSCPGAKQIKPENKLVFSSRLDAEAAGYKPASNCPGLQ